MLVGEELGHPNMQVAEIPLSLNYWTKAVKPVGRIRRWTLWGVLIGSNIPHAPVGLFIVVRKTTA